MTKGTERKDGRVIVSLMDLATAFKHNDYRAYGRLVKESKLSEEFTKRLTSKDDSWRKAKDADYQAAEVEILDDVIQNIEEDIEKQKKPSSDASEKLQIARKKLKRAEDEYKVAQKYFDEQKANMEKLENDKKEVEALRVQEIKKLKQIKKVTLVHPTATLSSLDKQKDTIIVCTSFDAKRMEFTRFVDRVFDSTESNLVEDAVLREAEKELNSFEELLSAVEYVNMVFSYWAYNRDYELLYNSKAIQLMLDSLNLK
ncbi:MAG: hypothetical protein HFJ35_08365 [Clostridia bacterium]|nr:hypothetical protein [Clostridia bacterium]